jgi:pilus assembly protein CpaE
MREMMRIISLRQAQTNVRLTRERSDEDSAEAGAGGGRNGKVYTVFSPRGGSGKTTFAVNLAVSMAQTHPDDVTLVDLSLTWGHCALVLNLVPKASIASMSSDAAARLDREGLNYYLVPHASTLKVLAGSSRPEEGEAVTADHVKSILDLLKRLNSVVVVDTGGTFSEATIAAIENSDRIIVLCTPELTTLRDIRECQRIFSDLIRVPKEKLYYVMNQTFPNKPIQTDQFQQALEQEMHAEIPYGGDVPAKASVRGEAFTQTQPGQAISKAIDRIARTLEADSAPAARQTERRGLFGRH